MKSLSNIYFLELCTLIKKFRKILIHRNKRKKIVLVWSKWQRKSTRIQYLPFKPLSVTLCVLLKNSLFPILYISTRNNFTPPSNILAQKFTLNSCGCVNKTIREAIETLIKNKEKKKCSYGYTFTFASCDASLPACS